LQQRADHRLVFEIAQRIADHDGPAERLGASAQHGERLWMHLTIDEERSDLVFGVAVRGALGNRHRFGGGGSFVEQRGVGDVEPGQVADHSLEVEQRFQPALADLRLIRGVGRVPRGVFEDVALDYRRQDGAAVALPDQRGEHLVLRGDLADMRERLGLTQRAAEIERRALADIRWQRFAHQRRQAGCADSREHRVDVARRGADVAADECGGRLSGDRGGLGHRIIILIAFSRKVESGSREENASKQRFSARYAVCFS
jgi:hypothetical protein